MKLFSVPISITSKPQALALVGDWLREWRSRKSQLKSARSAKIRLQKKSEKFDSDSADLSAIRSGPPAAGQADPAETSTFPKIITTPNPEIIAAAQSDPALMQALQSADLSIPDGIGIVWAVRLLHKRKTVDDGKLKVGVEDRKSKIEKFDPSSTIHPLPPSSIIHHPLSKFHRLSGLEFMESLIGESAKNGWKVMLLGGKPGVAERVAVQLRRKFKVQSSKFKVQAIEGSQNIEDSSKSENDRLISEINSFSPDLLFVAFGHPKQEKWLAANRESLNAGVAMGVGGALDQIADPSLRPPAYINSIGLGWLYRLLRQPRRWKRQLALVKFAGAVLRQKFQFSNTKLQ